MLCCLSKGLGFWWFKGVCSIWRSPMSINVSLKIQAWFYAFWGPLPCTTSTTSFAWDDPGCRPNLSETQNLSRTTPQTQPHTTPECAHTRLACLAASSSSADSPVRRLCHFSPPPPCLLCTPLPRLARCNTRTLLRAVASFAPLASDYPGERTLLGRSLSERAPSTAQTGASGVQQQQGIQDDWKEFVSEVALEINVEANHAHNTAMEVSTASA